MFLNKLIENLYLKIENNLVYFDSLTGLRSRMFYDRVCKSKYLDKECMIIYIDIDCLKVINDTKGHHEGNRYIQEVTNQLKELSNVIDICRIGGDEFVIFATKEFDIRMLNIISNITYGYYVKEKYEDVSSAVATADSYMYKYKKKKKKKRKKK